MNNTTQTVTEMEVSARMAREESAVLAVLAGGERRPSDLGLGVAGRYAVIGYALPSGARMVAVAV